MRRARHLWTEMAMSELQGGGLRSGGHLSLAGKDASSREAISAWASIAERAGVPFLQLDAHDLARDYPWLADEYHYAGFTPLDLQVEPTLMLTALHALAEDRGVLIVEDTPVTDLLIDQRHVRGVVTDRGSVAAPAVVVATGAWSRRLLARSGINLPIHVGVTTMAATAPVPPLTNCTVWEMGALGFRQDTRGRIVFAYGGFVDVHLVWEDLRSSVRLFSTYLRSRRQIRLRAGRDLARDLWDVVRRRPLRPLRSREYPANKGDVRKGTARLATMAPQLAGNLTVEEIWTGAIDVTADELPIVGNGGVFGLSFAAGLSGHGAGLAPALADPLAEIALTGATKDKDVQALSPERLHGYRPHRGTGSVHSIS